MFLLHLKGSVEGRRKFHDQLARGFLRYRKTCTRRGGGGGDGDGDGGNDNGNGEGGKEEGCGHVSGYKAETEIERFGNAGWVKLPRSTRQCANASRMLLY